MDRLESNPGLHFDVRFTMSRLPFCMMHRAVDLLVKQKVFDMVFPPGSSLPSLHVQEDIQ